MVDAEILASKPCISVLMPTFNSAKFLQAAMDSVFRQTCQNFEFLIVDDASSDDTIKIINSYHDKRIRILQQGSRKGLAAALNLGLLEAKGIYVARFDSDDLNYPHRFEQQAVFLDAHKDISILGTWQYHFGKANHIHRGVATHEELQIVSMFYCDLCHSTLMLRRNDIIKNNLFFSEDSPIEDFELWQKALLKVKFANMPIVLGAHRISGDSITDIKKNVLPSYETKIKVKYIHNLLQLDINKEDYDLIPSYRNPNSLEKIRYIKRFDNLLHKMEEQNKKIKLFDPELMRQCLVKVRVNLSKNRYLLGSIQSDFKTEVVETKEIEVLKRPASIVSQKASHIRGKESIPRVSIIMPTKDNLELLCEALDSIRGQTFKDWELIIIDDSSTEDIRKIVTSYKESRFQIVKGLGIGISSALNIGFDYAHGEYITRMDACDVSYKTRISKQVGFMDDNPDICVCDTEFVTNENYFWSRENKKHQQFYTNMLYMLPICHPTVMLRKSATKKVNLRYDETFGTGEDFEFFSRMILMHNIKFARISEPLLMHRIHNNNSSKKEHNGKENYFSVIRRNFRYVLGIELDETTLESFWIKEDYKFTFKKIKMLRKNYDTIISTAKVKADHNIDVSQLKDWLDCRFNKIKRETSSHKTIIRKNATKILETILYIKNEGRHKVVRLFGLKIKIKSKWLMMRQLQQQQQQLQLRLQLQRLQQQQLQEVYENINILKMKQDSSKNIAKVVKGDFLFYRQKRFDIIFKILYVVSRSEFPLVHAFYEKLYLKHIQLWNNYFEEEPLKQSTNDFLESFRNLIVSIEKYGFDKTKPILIGANGDINEGSHRLATCFSLNKDIAVTLSEDIINKYGYAYFLENKRISPDLADINALEYVKMNPYAFIVNIFPVMPIDYDVFVEGILLRYGFVYYKKCLNITYNGCFNLKKISYGQEEWVREHVERSMGTQEQGKQRVYVFVCHNKENLWKMKKRN